MISFNTHDIILVTGAGSGLGAATAKLLNRLGATIIGVSRSPEKLADIREDCDCPERFHMEPRDLAADIGSMGAWMKDLKAQYGKFAGLLAAAGAVRVTPVRYQAMDEMQALFDINVFSNYQLARAFLDRRNNVGPGASMVFLGSVGAERDNAGTSAYAASKGAVISMMRSMAAESAPQGIRVNAVSPDFIPTAMTDSSSDEHKQRVASFPLGPGTAEDVAHTAAFLLSRASRWITGQNVIVDGGSSLL